jgi:hypothetical protein
MWPSSWTASRICSSDVRKDGEREREMRGRENMVNKDERGK